MVLLYIVFQMIHLITGILDNLQYFMMVHITMKCSLFLCAYFSVARVDAASIECASTLSLCCTVHRNIVFVSHSPNKVSVSELWICFCNLIFEEPC